MNQAAARTSAPPPLVFRDAFGERRRIVAPTGSESVDVLCLRNELTTVPSFEFALRERVGRLASFRHPYFAQVRAVERLSDPNRTLALISNARPGVRLSELLATAARRGVVLDSDAALCLMRQLVTAMATFHEHAPDAAHGALGPERVVITPNARLVIVEHVMGAAIEQLQYSEDRYWRDLRVPCPRSIGLPVIDQRTDVLQLGLVALALIQRRSLNADEFPSRVGDALVSARAMTADGHVEALPSGLRLWLTASLQLDSRTAFASAIDARQELEKVFESNDDLGDPSALEAFLARYHESAEPAAEPPAARVSARQADVPEAAAPETVAADHSTEQAPPELVAENTSLPELTVEEPAAPESSRPEPLLLQPAPREQVAVHVPLERTAGPSPMERTAGHAVTPEPFPMQSVAQEPIARQPIAPASDPFSTAAFAVEPPAKLNRPVEAVRPPRFEPTFAHASPEYTAKEPIDMPSTPRKRGGSRAAVAAILLVALASGGTLAARRYLSPVPLTTGTVAVTTNPPGAQVVLDGKIQGLTPTTLTVISGAHVLELRGAGDPRTISLNVPAGAQLSQYIELAKGPLASGSLLVRTEPAGARVNVDGVARGSSPVTVADLLPGEHTVVVETEAGSTKQTVTVEAGTTASLVAQMPAAPGGPASGWITVSTPKSVQLFEDGHLLGSSDTERLMVSAGAHRLEIVNETIGYRDTRTVQVAAGKVSPIKIEFPKGTIALNAVPWADVWIDGEKVGETPIGNLPVTVGQHEIIFRHPDLGEQRHVVNVTLAAPARLSVDMRKKP